MDSFCSYLLWMSHTFLFPFVLHIFLKTDPFEYYNVATLEIRLFTPSVFVIVPCYKLQLFVCLVTFLNYSVKSLIFVISDVWSLSFFSLYSHNVLTGFLEFQELNGRETSPVFIHWLSSRTLLQCSFNLFQFLISPAGISSMMNSSDKRGHASLDSNLKGRF